MRFEINKMPDERPSSEDANISGDDDSKITFGNKIPVKNVNRMAGPENVRGDRVEAASHSGIDRKTVAWLALGAFALILLIAIVAGIYFVQGSGADLAEATVPPPAGAVIATSPTVPPTPVMPSPSATNIPAAAPSPTQTSSPVPTDTPLPAPTQEPTPLPAPTDPSTPVPVAAPMLSSPVNGAGTVGDLIAFAWQWDGNLQPEEYFEVRIWHEATPGETQAIGWVKVPQFDFNMGGQRAGNFLWTVIVVEGTNVVQKEWTLQPDWPYPIWEGKLVNELSPAAEPRLFIYVP
jgi:hypothetical protein